MRLVELTEFKLIGFISQAEATTSQTTEPSPDHPNHSRNLADHRSQRRSMPIPPILSHTDHTYLTLTLSPHSTLYTSPQLLSTFPLSFHPSTSSSSSSSASLASPINLTYISPIGELPDSHIFQIDRPGKTEFEKVKDQILGVLREHEGVLGVEVLGAGRMRSKRGGGEL